MNNLRSIYSSACSAAITIATVTAITIGAELSVPFKNWLAAFTGHHWITKSWISVIVFVLFFGIFRLAGKSANESKTRKSLLVLEIFAVLGFLAILSFYVYEFFAPR